MSNQVYKSYYITKNRTINQIEMKKYINNMYDFILKMKEIIGRILDNGAEREEKIEKTAKLSFDGDQFVVRIPKKISDALEFQKGNKMKFTVSLAYIQETNKKIMVVEILV